MRFITEFELAEGNINNSHLSIEARKDSEMKMGFEIGNVFGWESPVSGHPLRHKLAIEAFPMDKWIEFKNKLHLELLNGKPSGDNIRELLEELEFYNTQKKQNEE